MIQCREENGKLFISLTGILDSSNTASVESEIKKYCSMYSCKSLELDCSQLEYATSAGLRMILRLKQEVDDTVLTNVNPDLYNIFDLTGFTEMMEVRRACRMISVEGCEVIGQGANGKVYRIDPDTIVKVVQHPDALPQLRRERELARLAFVAGVPTAIPYDVVRIESGGYGSVFELLNAVSYAALIIHGEKTPDEAAEMSIRLLKLIHSREVHSEILPDMKAMALDMAYTLKDYLPEKQYDRLVALISAVPQDPHLLHGDFHLKNIMFQNGKSLLIDMDTLCHGHPVFELAGMYNAYVGFGLVNPGKPEEFLGIPGDICAAFWRRSLSLYLDTDDERRVDEVEAKVKILSLAKLMRREIRRGGFDRKDGKKMIDICRTGLEELLPRADTLVF